MHTTTIRNKKGILGPIISVFIVAVVAMAATIPVILDVINQNQSQTGLNGTTRTVVRQVPLMVGVAVLAATAGLIAFGRK